MISKFNALQTAMCTCFTMPDSMTSTIADIKDLIKVIYDKQAPTKDGMVITLYLHAMADGDFDWLHKIMIGSMTSNSKTLKPNKITCHLEIESQEACHSDSMKEGEKLLAAKEKKSGRSGSSMKCTNYQWSGHTIEKCWEDGEGSADKAPNWWKTAKEKKNGQKKVKERGSSCNTSSDVSDSDSCSLLHDSYTCSINWNNTLAPTTDLAAPIFTTPSI